MAELYNNADEIFDREKLPLPGGTNYYQMINGIKIESSKRREYYTKDEIDKIIEAAIAAGGGGTGTKTIECTFATLPEPSAENVGTIINVKDSFTTDSRFLEGAGKNYPAGTNLIITLDMATSAFVFDVMMGEIKSATDSEIQDIIDNLYKD